MKIDVDSFIAKDLSGTCVVQPGAPEKVYVNSTGPFKKETDDESD